MRDEDISDPGSSDPPSSHGGSSLWMALRRTIDRGSMWLLDWSPFDRLVGFLAYQRKRKIRRRVEARLRASGDYGDTVEKGPFKGMVYPCPETWVSARFEKLIGAYEAELHGEIESLVERKKNYSSIVNVGAAEGFFSVGFARLFPAATGFAFELGAASRKTFQQLAELNGVADRITLAGFGDPAKLSALEVGERPLMICDVDGYEETLMDLEAIPWLKRADILLELHDIIIPGMTDTIRRRFEGTHSVRQITMEGLRYAEYPILRELNFIEIDAMVGSDRAGLQDWFFMEPRAY